MILILAGGGGKLISFDSLKENEKSEGYVFHILSDSVSKSTRTKLQNLQKSLSTFYPCEIRVHILSDAEFKDFPKWKGNYMTYYRIKMGLILPKEIRKYLYLDSDMLAFTDIREFFAIDLQGKIVGAIEDFCFQKDKKMPLRENPQKFDSFYLKEYFCSGMMLVDLEKWREYEVEKKCLEILQKYIPQFPDQDALNLAIEGKNLILPPRWSFFNSVNLETSCKDSPRRCGIYLNCTMAEASEALENAAIMHYSYKPWDEINVYALSSEGRIVTLRDAIPHTFRFFKSWWEMAFQTPFFGKELLLQKIELSKVDLERYAWFMAENNKAKEEAMEKRFSEIFARLNGMESRILEIQKALGQSNMPQNTKENVLQEIKQFQGQIRDIRV